MTSVRSSVASLSVFVLLAAAPPPTAAQQPAAPAAPAVSAESLASRPVPRLVDGHPDLSGFWAVGRGPDTPVNSVFGARDPNIKRGDAPNAKAQYEDPNQPPYKPALMDKVKDLAKNESKMDPAFFCKPGGVPRIGPPHAILQVPGMPIVLLYAVNSGNTFRLVPTDGRPHDPDADPSYYGDSIGRWDGDTLVIDTTDFNDDTWLGIYGWFHSESLHVVERLTRVGDTLRYQATVEDPEVLTKPWTMNQWVSVRTTKEIIVENAPCRETDIGHIADYDLKTRQ